MSFSDIDDGADDNNTSVDVEESKTKPNGKSSGLSLVEAQVELERYKEATNIQIQELTEEIASVCYKQTRYTHA